MQGRSFIFPRYGDFAKTRYHITNARYSSDRATHTYMYETFSDTYLRNQNTYGADNLPIFIVTAS